MFGVHASVTALLKKKCPHLLAVKCSCHMSHLCTSYACKCLPPILEKSVKWMYNHFARSSNRKNTFAEFQQFTEVTPHAILKACDARWLSLEAAVVRILEMYLALQLYFNHSGAIVLNFQHSLNAENWHTAWIRSAYLKNLYFACLILKCLSTEGKYSIPTKF